MRREAITPDDRPTGRDAARELLGVVVFGLAYLVLVDLSWRFLDPSDRTIYWFPGGLATGVLLRVERRRWPAFLAAIPVVLLLAGALGFPEARDPPPAIHLVWALENTAVPFVVAHVLERWNGGPLTFTHTREAIALLLASLLVVPAVGAVVELPVWWLWPEGRTAPSFVAMLLGYTALYSTPVLALVPVIVTLPRRPPFRLPGSRGPELAGIALLLAVLTGLGFFLPSRAGRFVALSIAAFPVLGWIAARFGVAAAAQGAFALAVVGTALTIAGHGPFGDPAFGIDRLVFAQGFFAVSMISSLIAAAEAFQAREQAARREETLALLDTLTGSAPVGIYVVDPALRFERANEALARITGWPLERLIGRPFAEVAGPVVGQVEPILRRVLETGEPRTDVDVTRGTGPDARHLLASYYPIRVGGGPIRGVGALVVDITERKRQERELARLYREAQDAIRVRDDFLGIASHELKTPLTPLSSRLQWLRRQLAQGKPADPSTVDQALASLDKLTALINDLLDASRIERGGLALHVVPVDLVAILREVVAAPSLAPVAHRLQVELPDRPIWIRGDGPRIAQVIDNLLSNAVKYSPRGGPVLLRVEPGGTEAVVSVEDQGIGIPADEKRFLFDRFFRARNASPTAYGGLGLGLHVSHDIVARHGGRIWAESEVERGSTFHVALPLLEATPEREPDEDPAGSPRRAGSGGRSGQARRNPLR